MRINAETMTAEINSMIREMKATPSLEEAQTAIYQTSGMQVLIVVTRNEDDFCDCIVDGIASA